MSRSGPSHAKSLVPWLLVGVVLLIAYGTLYPFNFSNDGGGVWQALQSLSWARAGRRDQVSNVLLYVPLGFCLLLWLEARWGRWSALALAVLLGAALSLILEVAQVYLAARVPSLRDLILNVLGTAIGAAAGVGWRTLSVRLHLSGATASSDRIAALTIVFWLAWRLAPFLPHFDLGKLKAALAPVMTPHFPIASTLAFLSYWLALSQAVFARASRPLASEWLLLLIASVLLGQLFIAQQALIPAELLALALLLPVLIVLHRIRYRWQCALISLSLVGIMCWQRLGALTLPALAESPRHGTINFAWMNVPEICRAAFLFTALTWLLRQSGFNTRIAAISVLVFVVALECLQWWRGATAVILNVIVAAAVAVLLPAMDRRSRG